jgi:hypothetical protein
MTQQHRQKLERPRSDPVEDELFEVLSSERRRHILRVLHKEGPLELPTLAEHVAAIELETTVDELDAQERKRVYISCYQTHVSRLVDAGFAEHDEETGMVSPRPELHSLIASLGWQTPSNSPYSVLLLGLLSALFYLGVLLNLPLLGAIPQALAGAIVVLALFGYGLYSAIR